MPKFLFVFHGGHAFKSRDDATAYMQKWRQWSTSLGAAVADPGAPVGPSKTVSAGGVADNGGSNPVSGVMFVEASDMAAALRMAKPCPHLEIGGTIEVAEAMNMGM